MASCSLLDSDTSMSLDERFFERLDYIDTHTGGEPTRVVFRGGPDLGDGDLASRCRLFRDRFDEYRSAIVNEPRGSDVMVGALLCEPTRDDAVAGVIFFNNVGVLGMCGHGTIGVTVALAHMHRLGIGAHRLETPVGVVTVHYEGEAKVSFENVPCYRHATGVKVTVPGHGEVMGDIAWGGNWFFLAEETTGALERQSIDELTSVTVAIRRALRDHELTGVNGAEIDHVELFGPPRDPANDSRNFVLCPGLAYDRSPCGTGTSAKMACLFGDGKLRKGDVWRQEGILGSVFEGSLRETADGLVPRIRGTAYVTAEGSLLLDPNDPFRMGIRS